MSWVLDLSTLFSCSSLEPSSKGENMSMRFYAVITCFIGIFSAASYSFEKQPNWLDTMGTLADGIDVSRTTRQSVLSSLAGWNPEQCSMLWQAPMTIRDRYLEDETVRNNIRATFLPRIMNRAYSMAVGEVMPTEQLEILSHGMSAGLAVLKNVHKVPYIMWAAVFGGDCSLVGKSIDFRDCLESGFSVASHACAIGACTTANPLFFAGSVACGLASYGLSIRDEFTDVVLRSFKRYYKKIGHEEAQALVEHMIAKRKLTPTKEKND